MLSSLAVLAAAQGMVVTAAAPPPIVAVPTLVRAPSRAAGDVYGVPVTPVVAVPIHVRVTAGSQQLFNDTFRVTRSAGASYQESRSEAPETVCAGERYYSSQERNSLNINLYLRDETSSGPMVNVSVSWQRPSKLASCGEGSRQVQLTQTVPLAAGQSVTIQGDAGLTVTISR